MFNKLGKPFTDFLKHEVERFEVIRNGKFAFDAKQRMLERAQSYAVIEAFRIPFIKIWKPPLKPYLKIIREAERKQVLAREREINEPSHEARAPHTTERHREELKMALCTFTIQYIESRRLQMMALIAAWAALVLAIVAIIVSLLTSCS